MHAWMNDMIAVEDRGVKELGAICLAQPWETHVFRWYSQGGN